MFRRRRVKLAALGATIAAGALMAGLLTSPSATADVAGPYFAIQGNGSDPHMIRCVDPATQGLGFCLYTSQDMGWGGNPPLNYYPMYRTKLYFSANGINNWIDKGPILQESQLSWVPQGANHLWAPGAVRSGNNYYLYVPDVSDAGDPGVHTSSRIAVAHATNPFGPYSVQGTVTVNGYMSDPDVYIAGNSRTIIWADGDYSTCGGFKGASLNTDMRTLTPNTIQTVTINGVNVLGNCGGTGRPYMEGATLVQGGFKGLSSWILLFAAKPSGVPAECTDAVTGSGSAGTANEVIAYATSGSMLGPYTYKGIIMCGSRTEWTNQATITEAGASRYIVYHDGPASGNIGGTHVYPQRKLHAECLWAHQGRIAAVYRNRLNDANGFDACMAGTNMDYKPLHIKGTASPNTGTPLMLSANSGGNAPVAANRYAVGPWERFRAERISAYNYVFRSLANGKLICAPNGLAADELIPSCTTVTAKSTFNLTVDSMTSPDFRMKNNATGLWVTIKTNNRLAANNGDELSGARFTVFG